MPETTIRRDPSAPGSSADPKRDATAFDRDLESAAAGDQAAKDAFWGKHYDELRACAQQWFRQQWRPVGRRADISIGPTHIINAVYERLRERTAALSEGRAWFFHCFYNECVRVFIDHLRRTKRHKGRRAELEAEALRGTCGGADEAKVADVLTLLQRLDPTTAQVAMLKILANRPDPRKAGAVRGVQNQEVADELGICLREVEKRWPMAKAFLMRDLGAD